MQIGDMNVPNAIIDLEVSNGVLTRIIEWMAGHSGSMPSQAQVDSFKKQSQQDVIKKYPLLGVQFN